ncbi:MAG: DNA mismatch repair protein MutS [Desulfobacterales bacterium SG8_35_2]|nr:MAG: DNA mismatch repair protein MutS [Desulfobacterales bacterium SG8_35_2]
MSAKPKITPMLQQYMEIKAGYEDAILFYRMGDFYEMFFDDAVVAAKILGITLTSRSSKNEKNKIPMCGVPHHAVSSYMAKLVKAGHRVAVCEQVEDPRLVKGGKIVKREVVRVVTPGVTTEEQLLDDKSNRYLAAISLSAETSNSHYGASYLDISTGEFLVSEHDTLDELLDELSRMAPAELLINESEGEGSKDVLQSIMGLLPNLCLTTRAEHTFHFETARDVLLEHFQTLNLAGFGCEQMEPGISAAGALLQYISETQKTACSHIEKLIPVNLEDVLIVDEPSRRNLELAQTIVGGSRKGSLLETLDYSSTSMGARLLKRRLLFPLRDVGRIRTRLQAVEQLYLDNRLRQNLRDLLAEVYDLERLNSRVVLGSANPRDLLAIRNTLTQLPPLKNLIAAMHEGILHQIGTDLNELPETKTLLEKAIRDDAPVTLREGKIIREGFHPELDELMAIQRDGRSMILALEAKERERTGIANLKIGFNKVFGYYLEVSRGQLANVPEYFIRKQTLVNGERFITPDLKEFESKVLGAEEKRLTLEYQIFTEIRNQVAAQSSILLETAAHLARLDYFACLAEAAHRHRYVKPHVADGEEITIIEGRHPVIEQTLPSGRFVPNDIHLDQENEEVLIITGPNMAGKSTVLRQIALIVLMAQMGSFVPAAKADIGVVDRIFTRVGAMDDLRRGQSTFMVEMNETANILNNATENSLVILDEIGRGTSTFDGLAIAWAVAEDLVNKNNKGVKTLFATHYHELTELALTRNRVKNFNIGVREWNDSIIFLHKLMRGSTNRSYGIQVAALAGVPPKVVERAHEILKNIEKGEFDHFGKPRIAASTEQQDKKQTGTAAKHPNQLSLFVPGNDPVREKLETIKPDALTPLDALNLLYELKKLSEE